MKRRRPGRIFHPRRGASVAIALLLFLLLSLAGASALVMASANAGRYSHADENRQAYYSVSSAALLMVDLLDGLTYRSATAELRETHETRYSEDAETGGSRETSDVYTLNFLDGSSWDDAKGYALTDIAARAGEISVSSGNGTAAERESMQKSKLVESVRRQCDAVVPYLSVPQEWYGAADASGKTRAAGFMPSDIVCSFTVRPSESSLGTVGGTLRMSADYRLTLSFSYAGEDGEEYTLRVFWEADVREERGQEEPVVTYTESGDVASVSTGRTLSVSATWRKENVTFSDGGLGNA